MNNFLTKYNSLRQQPWTHILMPFPFIYWGYFIYSVNMYIEYGPIVDLEPLIFILLGTAIFLFGIIIAAIIAIINLFLKKKVTNNFFTKNKLYGFLWHIGNILFILFIIINSSFIIYAIFYRISMGCY